MRPATWRWSIDEPAPLFAEAGWMRCAGWCLNESAEAPVRVRIVIGDHVLTCETGLKRTDVGAAFPNVPNARLSGFSREGWVPFGYAIAHFEASLDDHDWYRLDSLAICSEVASPIAHIDTPLEKPLFDGPVKIWGWVLHPQDEIDSLLLHAGPVSIQCFYGAERQDVVDQYPDVAHAKLTGFEADLTLPPGRFPLSVTGKLKCGRRISHSFHKHVLVADRRVRRFLRDLDENRAALIRFPAASAPRVSIIIAVYNQIEVTLTCLKSILSHTHDVTYEVIMVDDCSNEQTSRCLSQVHGLRVIRNEKNRGFLRSCNIAAAAADGDYLLFLNNDTEVTRGWLTALLRVFDQRPNAGLVGAKLIYPDGRLQEAGGILWRDASGVNYGKWGQPEQPEYNYLREVDFCSGACVIIPRPLFSELGGFDDRYAPAYYEDADLAFQVRASGRAVLYQPHSCIIHHEGQSCGTSTDAGVKRYQLVNQVKFQEKWREELALLPPPSMAIVDRAKDRGVRKRVLVIDARVLRPDQDAGSLRMLNLLVILQRLGLKPTFVPANGERLSPYTGRMQELGIECLYHPYFLSVERFLEARGPEFDAIIVSRAEVADAAVDSCRAYVPGVPLIFDTVDLHFLRAEREAVLAGTSAKREAAENMRQLELGVATKCDAVVVVSPVEKEILARTLPDTHVAVISLIHKLGPQPKPFVGRRDLLFIGGFEHTPNVDAMLWFTSEVLPLVVSELPGAKLHIIGSKMPDEIRTLASPTVTTHGYVEKVEPFFERCLLSIAPLRYGAGVKGKINQSMAHGLPVVATTLAAEGMYLEDGDSVLLADTPQEFAERIVTVSQDQLLWEKLSAGGRRNIEEHFSFEAAEKATRELLAQVGVLSR